MARDNIFSSLTNNLKSTALTTLYGGIGIASTIGLPVIGKTHPIVGAIMALVPIFSRVDQATEIAENAKIDKSQYIYSIIGKVLVNSAMPIISGLAGVYSGQPFAYALLGSWIGAKIISGGDNSPLEFLENIFSNKKIGENSLSRKNFVSSFVSNIKDTVMATWYGLIGMATTTGAPILGTITPAVGAALALTPLASRLDQIKEMQALYPVNSEGNFYKKAITKVIINAVMGAGIAAVAVLTASPQVSGGVLFGWIASKILSSGDNSPLEYIQGNNTPVPAVAPPSYASAIRPSAPDQPQGSHHQDSLKRRDSVAPSAPASVGM
jgi:hypothetical protein